ncbi:MAG: hypothetical protein PUA61_03175 [Succinatimonas hippei]|nr:hypothetical protein [Succinatimonas hippei]
MPLFLQKGKPKTRKDLMAQLLLQVGKLFPNQILEYGEKLSSAEVLVLSVLTSISRCAFYREHGFISWTCREIAFNCDFLMSPAMISEKIRNMCVSDLNVLERDEKGIHLKGDLSGRYINVVRLNTDDPELQKHSVSLLLSYLLDECGKQLHFDGYAALSPNKLLKIEKQMGITHKTFISALRALIKAGFFSLTDPLGIAKDEEIRIRFKDQVLRPLEELMTEYAQVCCVKVKASENTVETHVEGSAKQRIKEIVENGIAQIEEVKKKIVKQSLEIINKKSVRRENKQRRNSIIQKTGYFVAEKQEHLIAENMNDISKYPSVNKFTKNCNEFNRLLYLLKKENRFDNRIISFLYKNYDISVRDNNPTLQLVKEESMKYFGGKQLYA